MITYNSSNTLGDLREKFLAPIIFDEITKHEIIDKESFSLDEQIIITDNSVEIIKEKYNIYGVIEGKTYKYDGNNLVKLEETKIEYPKTYELVKRKIEKQKN